MTFNSLILIWFDNNQRNLPWRDQSDPYKIWLSEIILQQTRVAQGINYYLNFVATYPQIQDLAAASEQEVLRLWQGLGYYSRARNLHATAQFIVENLDGKFPDNYKDLLKLKGIGPYTAAAIASIAFNETVSAIDGNVFRVFARYFNLHLDISESKTRNYFFELGNKIIDRERPGDFNQAVMELGATVCLPVNPKCELCPVNDSCEARAKKTIQELPIKTKKTKVSHRYFHFMEISDGENYLMTKREGKDVWKNLFTFPLIETSENESLPASFASEFKFEKTHEEIHVLSHQKLNISFWKTKMELGELKRFSEKLDAGVYSLSELDELPLPRPIEKYLNERF
ncbi:MAG: A/G-specific adenine glycosylase [Flavobacteriaceae bacterium]|jgi:A/G-specific adenine glycosylase|nr:A/G-specific adenine glycosylase [Flavobacteriaceae bacterium]